jgi:hypothetical protein
MALPDKPVYGNTLMMDEAEKPKTKMKKSELKDKIKEMVLSEMEKDVNITDESPENEEDFLAEIEAMLAEADEEAPAEDAAEDAPAEDETAVDDAEVAVDGEENIEVDTTAEVDPNVKAVQDSLTQAQAAAQKLGDAKLTDQIGNTITFFTRSHVVDKGAVAEGMDVQSKEDIEDFLDGMINDSIPEDSEEGEEVKGVWEASEYADEDAYGEAANEFINAYQYIKSQGGRITIEGNPDVTYSALNNGNIRYELIVTLD